MARGKKSSSRRPRLSGVPNLTLAEGRKQLHQVANEFAAFDEPSESLLDRAIDIGPYRKGGAVLIPEIDAVAAVERLERVEQENDELLEELEDMGILLLAQERLATETPVDRLIPLDELARQFGREHLLAD